MTSWEYQNFALSATSKAADYFLPALEFVLDGLLQVKWLKKFLLLYIQMLKCSIFNQDSGDTVTYLIKWVFLVQSLIILTLMILIMM